MHDIYKRLDNIDETLSQIKRLLSNQQPQYNFKHQDVYNNNYCIDCINKVCMNAACPNRLKVT